VEPILLQERAKTALKYSTSIWGPSCDGLDRIIEHSLMPELEVGEWMYFRDMGAYTMCAGSEFNGFKRPVGYYVLPDNLVSLLHRLFPDNCTPCSQQASLKASATPLTNPALLSRLDALSSPVANLPYTVTDMAPEL